MPKNEKSTAKKQKRDITACYGELCDRCQEPCRWKEAGRSRLADERHDKSVASGATRIYDFKENFSVAFRASNSDAGGDNANLIRLFYWSMKNAPVGTMAILERAFEGKNQSDAARKRGVSRQAISKMYKKELSVIASLLGIRRPNLPESHIWRLSPLEFQVMQLIHTTPDITEREIAAKLNRPQTTIHRAKASAILKMNQNPPSKPHKKRINKKTA